MIDTVAMTMEVEIEDIDVSAFGGESRSEDFGTGEVYARLYLNPGSDRYAPRYTYWPGGGVLKAECSLPKMIGKDGENLSALDVVDALGRVNAHILETFSLETDVMLWRCLRVDYVYNWKVAPSAEFYIKTYGGRSLSRMSRHDFGGDGVVWKQGNRWLKLYDKTKERGVSSLDAESVLRLEVSNYKDAVRYMAENWFGCEPDVYDMTLEGRALYVLARYFNLLGMNQLPTIQDVLLVQLRDEYGTSAPQAFYALSCMNSFGRESIKLGLLSSSSYYSWRKKLEKSGYLLTFGDRDQHQMTHSDFRLIGLPLEGYYWSSRKILNDVPAWEEIDLKKILREILALSEKTDVDFLERGFERWHRGLQIVLH